MARVRLHMQNEYEFSNTLQMRVSDMNIAGHIGNFEMVRIIDEARFMVLRTLGIKKKDLTEGKMTMVMSDVAINFKSEGVFSEFLTIDNHIGDIQSRGFRIYFRVMQKGTLIALAETGMVFFDLQEGEISHVPDAFLASLQAYRDEMTASGTEGAPK